MSGGQYLVSCRRKAPVRHFLKKGVRPLQRPKEVQAEREGKWAQKIEEGKNRWAPQTPPCARRQGKLRRTRTKNIYVAGGTKLCRSWCLVPLEGCSSTPRLRASCRRK